MFKKYPEVPDFMQNEDMMRNEMMSYMIFRYIRNHKISLVSHYCVVYVYPIREELDK